MDRTLAARVELETLHELLPELNYYTILKLHPDAHQDDVGPAFRNESRRLHPDRFTAIGDADLQEKVNELYRLIREAYGVLQDPVQRAAYDSELEQGNNRMTAEGSARADQQRAAANDPAEAATTEKAAKYWQMGLKDFREKNFKGAVMNIGFALMYEPDNETFKEYLEQAKAGAEASAKENFNPYKLRIV